MPKKQSNKDILTRGQKYFESKKARPQPAEITFDPENRNEYLTGFHKRKLQRQKVAKDFKEKQLHQERLDERQRIRDERKQAIQEKLQLIKDSQAADDSDSDDSDDNDDNDDQEKVKQSSDKAKAKVKVKVKVKENPQDDDVNHAESDNDDEEWNGFNDEDNRNTTKGILKRKVVFENADDDQQDQAVTTVTIEALSNNDDLTNGSGGIDLYKIAKLNCVELEKSEEVLKESVIRAQKYAVLSGAVPMKPKKKKFRYLSKEERKHNAWKERGKKAKSISR
ncbi:Rrp17 protein [Saccharomycopsis crataegensis]|uniref:Rrp17 protein n=1 Tax=Saccharomycopsis crataegensis TaxID=43959 RepID=A0AAV5QSF0_9ASCO|nr:Rrp17 protein [Saccharomycopsis crataegensis]